MEPAIFLSCLLMSCFFITSATARVYFSTLPRTLVVTSVIWSHNSPASNVAKAGEDELVVTWNLNESLAGGEVDSKYKSVKVKLCFAPVSQVERAWRKTNDDLDKDKTCQFQITKQSYSSSPNNTFTWTVEKDVPGATYFVRAYALDASGTPLAYGQTADKNKTTNLVVVEPISGRHASLDIAAGVFSAFSVVSLFGFFAVEKFRARNDGEMLIQQLLNSSNPTKDHGEKTYLGAAIKGKARVLIAQLRTGWHHLRCETGRWKSPKETWEERTCIFCNKGVVETERHFFMECTAYEDIRKQYANSLCMDDMQQLFEEDKIKQTASLLVKINSRRSDLEKSMKEN